MRILALDLGKSNSVACVFEGVEAAARYRKVASVPQAMHDLIVAEQPERVVFEIGPQAGWLHDLVAGLGIAVQVANPNNEGWRWRNVKRKTDRLDALKLAKLSSMDQVPLVHVPQAAVRQRRSLIKYRVVLVCRRTAIKNGIRSVLHQQGLKLKAGQSGWSRESMAYLADLARPLEACQAEELWRGQLQEELAALQAVRERIAAVEAKLDKLGAADKQVALRYNGHLLAVYQRFVRGRKGRRKIAIVAAARKLLVWAWAMLQTGRRWPPPPLSKAA
jgi:transposase